MVYRLLDTVIWRKTCATCDTVVLRGLIIRKRFNYCAVIRLDHVRQVITVYTASGQASASSAPNLIYFLTSLISSFYFVDFGEE